MPSPAAPKATTFQFPPPHNTIASRPRARQSAGRHAVAPPREADSALPGADPSAAPPTAPVVHCPGLMALDLHRADAAYHVLRGSDPASADAARRLAGSWARFLAVVAPGLSGQAADAIVALVSVAAAHRRVARDHDALRR